jgi:hypothetical protein
MISGAKVGAFGDANITADANGGQVIYPAVFANPAVISNDEVPRILNEDGWFDNNSITDTGTKGS